MGRLTVAAAAGVAVASLVVAPQWVLASPTPGGGGAPCARGYSYAGYASRAAVRGVVASISATRVPTVASGHAAAWVGVGGVHQARGRESAWLQVGIAAFPGRGLHLYVEAVSLGQARRFLDLGAAAPARSYRVAVVETGPDLWRASIDRRPVGKPAYLPAGTGAWRGIATAESWADGRVRCNRFGYRFERVTTLGATGWNALSEAQLIGRGVIRDLNGFSASAGS
jgi:hypothetical protein